MDADEDADEDEDLDGDSVCVNALNNSIIHAWHNMWPSLHGNETGRLKI